MKDATSIAEVREAVNAMKLSKASGPDEFPAFKERWYGSVRMVSETRE